MPMALHVSADHRALSGAITRRFAGSVGAALAAIAGEKGADLIVAGGYGHSPLSEWIWGGVTTARLQPRVLPTLPLNEGFARCSQAP
jgi:nucleotide-binding universal stress UspA family protein